MLYMHAYNEIGPLPVQNNPQDTIIIRPLPYHSVPPVGVVLHGNHSTDDGEGPFIYPLLKRSLGTGEDR